MDGKGRCISRLGLLKQSNTDREAYSDRNVFSDHSGGYTSEIKVSAGSHFLRRC